MFTTYHPIVVEATSGPRGYTKVRPFLAVHWNVHKRFPETKGCFRTERDLCWDGWDCWDGMQCNQLLACQSLAVALWVFWSEDVEQPQRVIVRASCATNNGLYVSCSISPWLIIQTHMAVGQYPVPLLNIPNTTGIVFDGVFIHRFRGLLVMTHIHTRSKRLSHTELPDKLPGPSVSNYMMPTTITMFHIHLYIPNLQDVLVKISHIVPLLTMIHHFSHDSALLSTIAIKGCNVDFRLINHGFTARFMHSRVPGNGKPVGCSWNITPYASSTSWV